MKPDPKTTTDPTKSDLALAVSSLSAANLSFLAVWRELVFYSERDLYFMPLRAGSEYIAAITDCLTLTVLLFGVLWFMRQLRRPYDVFFSGVIFVTLITPVDMLRLSYFNTASKFNVLLAGAIASVLMLWFHRRFRGWVVLLFLICSPFALTTLLQAAWLGVSTPKVVPPKLVAELNDVSEPGDARRVLWLTFDKLDGRELFSARPLDYAYPNFDGFRSSAVYFSKAAPAGGWTLEAMASIFLGRHVVAEPTDAHSLIVKAKEEGQGESLTSRPHLFKTLRQAGARTAIVGYYLPYGRLFAGDYDYSSNRYYHVVHDGETRPFWQTVKAQWRALTPLWRRQAFIESVERIQNETVRLATDERYDFVAVHHPLPHNPNIYDPKAGSTTAVGLLSYSDNLAFADRSLGEIVDAMQRIGTWSNTIIVIGSDHGTVPGDPSAHGVIPLMVRFPREGRSVVYDRPVNAVILKDLLVALYRGDIDDSDVLRKWVASR